MSRHKFEGNGENAPQNKPHLHFPDLSVKTDQFGFGLEAEFLLIDLLDSRPLWYRDVSFKQLNGILESISFEDLPGDYTFLEVEAPHTKKMPFVVEGYHIPNENFEMVDMRPKGVEIRTPVCSNLEDCMFTYKKLYLRMQEALSASGLRAAAISHHPTEFLFDGPMNKRRYDFWLWAKEVMTTYGPDINVSVPTYLLENFSLQDFEQKINFYAPALAAISLGSPFFKNKVWKEEQNSHGKSYRTYKRSTIAPAIEYHPDEANRFEFKIFEMSPYLEDFENYFLLFLTLVLSEKLNGRADKNERIYKMGEVAVKGLQSEDIKKRIEEVIEEAYQVLPKFNFSVKSLKRVQNIVASNKTLADELVEIYRNSNSIPETLKFTSELRESLT